MDATIVSPVRLSRERTCTLAELSTDPRDPARRVRARRCRLVVVGVEVGSRFGAEAATWLRLLAGHRALEVPLPLRAAARAAWVARWSGLLALAAQRAIAASLLELPLAGECNLAGDAPELHEVLADVRWQLPVLGSRQGPR